MMRKTTCWLIGSGLAAAVLLLLQPGAALAGDWVDTRVTFTISDDNVLAGVWDQSPSAGIGAKRYELFFENLETRDVGDETQTHLVLYKKSPSFFENFEAEAALALEFILSPDEEGELTRDFDDDGSYIKLNYFFRGMDSKDNLSLLCFPYNADRFQLGYSFEIAWGSKLIFPNNTGAVPGLKINYERYFDEDTALYVFGGMKTHPQRDERINELETVYAGLFGFGYDFLGDFRFEMNGGFFQQGANPLILDVDVPIETFGTSARFTYHVGLPISKSVDFKLYRNPPDYVQPPMDEAVYGPDWSWLLAGEFSFVGQTLEDPNAYGSSKIQPAKAAAINIRIKRGWWRFFADAYYRDLAFILLDVPSFTPFVAIPDEADTDFELFFAAGVDYYISKWHFTPGIIAGLQIPATYTGAEVQNMFGLAGTSARRTVVVRDMGDFSILPEGKDAWPMATVKFSFDWMISGYVKAMAEVFYEYDPNATRLARVYPTEEYHRVFKDKENINKVGFSLMLQARF